MTERKHLTVAPGEYQVVAAFAEQHGYSKIRVLTGILRTWAKLSTKSQRHFARLLEVEEADFMRLCEELRAALQEASETKPAKRMPPIRPRR